MNSMILQGSLNKDTTGEQTRRKLNTPRTLLNPLRIIYDKTNYDLQLKS